MKLEALHTCYIPVLCNDQDSLSDVAGSYYRENVTPGYNKDGIMTAKSQKTINSMQTTISGKSERIILHEVEKLGLTANTIREAKVLNDADQLAEQTDICNVQPLTRTSSNNLNLIQTSETHTMESQSSFNYNTNSARCIAQNEDKITSDIGIEDKHDVACEHCTVLRINNGLKCSYSEGCLNIIQGGMKIVWNTNRYKDHCYTSQNLTENNNIRQSESRKNVENNVFDGCEKSKTESQRANTVTNVSSFSTDEQSQCDNVGIKSFGHKSMQWVKTVKVRQSKREHNMFLPSSF